MKKFLLYATLLIIILIIGFFAIDYYVAKKVKNSLDKQSSISYKELNINTFFGSLSLEDFHFDDDFQNVKVKKCDVSIDIFDYLMQDEIKIESITAENLDLNLNQSKDDKNESSFDIDTLNIDKIHLKNAKLSLRNKSEKLLDITKLNIQADNISWPLADDYLWLKNSNLKVDAVEFRYELDELHFLKTDNFTFDKKTLSCTNFTIQPKYSKSDYIDYIKTEKDRIQLKTSSLAINNLYLSKEKNKKLRLHIPQMQINDSDLNIYRDKTIADDHSIKPLYSQALRELGFQVQVDTFSLSSLDLTYQEFINKNKKACEIKFNSIKGQVTNLHNSINANQPEIKAGFQGKFTPNSMIDFRLNFVPDHERFYISTFLKNIEDQAVNGFFEPAMNLKMDGRIDEIKTSISANNSTMSGDFKLTYDKLKIDVLQQDGSKNGFLSTVGNIFVKNNDVKETIKINDLKRDKTKSLWNYIWSFHLEGLKKVML